MPIRDKVYDKLKSIGLTDSKEDFFKYYDNDENVRKQAYNKLRDAGLNDSEEDFYEYMKPQQTMAHQSEDDAVFEANAERFRNGQPIERVTTQSLIDANPELGLQTNAVQPENPKWNVPQYDWRTDQQKKIDELNNSTTATPVQDQYGNEYYPVKPREVAYDEAVKGLKDISERKAETKSRLQTISNDVSNELNRLQSQVEVSDLDKFRPANLQSMPVNPVNQELMPEYTALRKAQRLVEESNNIIEEASKKGNTNFMAGLARGFWDNLNAEDYTFGADDAAQSAFLYRALDKAEKGESLTKAEETLLDAAAINMAVQSYYAQDLGKGYGAGQVTAENIPFMLEMAINPISASGKTTAKALLNYGLKKFAKNKAAKVGARLAGDALAATGMAATTGFGDVLEGTTDRLAQNYNYQLDDEGRLHVEKKDDTMGMGEAFARSFATRAIENQSEMIFKAFEPIGGFMKGVQDILPGGVNKFFEMLGNNKAADAYRAIKNSPVFRNYLVKDIRNATQIGGLGEEYLEEVYNNIANAAIGEMEWEDVVSLDKNIDTLLGLAPTQVMFGLLGLGGAGAMRYQTRKTLEDLQATMNEQQRKDLEGLLDMGLDAKEVDVRGFIRNVMQNENYTIENKRELIKAAYNVAKQNGIDELTEVDTIDKVNAENALIDSVTDPSTGIYTEITATLPDAKEGTIEVPGYVVGWLGEGEKRQPIFVQEGMDNTYENRRVLKPGQWSEEAVQQMPAEEVKAINEEMIREEAAQQAEQEAKYAPEVLNAQMQQGVPFDTPNTQIIPVAPMPEGNGWIVEEYALDTNNKVAKTPIVRELTNDEYRDMLQAQLNAEEAAQKQLEEQAAAQEVIEETQPTEEADIKENLTTESVNNLSPVEEVAQPQAEVQAPVIPTKEDGSIDFVSYGKEGTFKTLGEKYGEKMPNKVAVTAKALAEDLKKAQNKLQKAEEAYDNAPIGREQKAEEARDKAKQELEAIQREANFWAEMDAEIKDAQARRESMLNPQAEVETSTEPMNVDEFVAQQLTSGNIVLDKEDYKKETGYGDTEANAMNGGATKLFGKNGMTIQEAGERLMEIDRENGTNLFDHLDSNSGRDALINVLGSVKSRKELNQYIATNRAEQAKKESEGLRNELEKQAMEANYASLEDYVLQMEVEEMENPFLNDRTDEIMAIFAEEAAKYEQSLNNTENGQGTENEVVEGNDSILSEEQLDNTGRTEVSEESERIGDGTSEESESTHAATEVELKQEEGETTLQFAERAAEENRRRPLRKRAEEWSNTLGVKVTYLESIDDVDAKTRTQIEAAHAKGSSVPGWVDKNGEVFFFMPDLRDLKDVDDTYIHEVVAHVGLPQLLGKERFGELCDKVWEMMPQSAKDYYMSYPGVKNHRDAADEYIAHLAEQQNLTPEEKTIWDNIVKMFREMLDKALNGIISKSKLTDEDISNLIKASYANLKSGAEGSVESSTRFKVYKSKDGKKTKYKQLSLFGEGNETTDDRTRPNNLQREGDSTIERLNHLRELQEGEICNVERKFTESKEFSFTRGEKVESTADVAYIFKSLEDEAVENSFVAITNGDNLSVFHLGMGAQTETVVDTSAILAAVDRLDADKVFFVHNHPSGMVKCSRQDVLTYQKLKDRLGDKLQDGIIINARSGKYGLFNSSGLVDDEGKIKDEKNEYPLKVYKFNKQSFNVDVIPVVEASSSGIAEFVSTQRLGKRDKVNALLLNNQFGCVGNILIDNSKNMSYVAERITNDAITMGARQVVIYGRYPFVEVTDRKTNFASYLSSMINGFSQGNVNLIDIIQIDEPYSKSANDEGVRFRVKFTPEERTIIKKAKTDGSYMKAPNGKPTNLTEKQWAQVRTQAFKKWFGDWENDPANASKVVDEYGEPLVVYHTSHEEWSEFNKERGYIWSWRDQERPGSSSEFGAIEYSLFMNLRNPFVFDAEYQDESDIDFSEWDGSEHDSAAGIVSWAVEQNSYDGVVIKNVKEFSDRIEGNDYVAFKPNQIKSATDNVGTFDEGNNDIRFRFIGERGARNLDKAEEATTRLDNLNVAREMEAAEKDAKTIKMATGWERGADGLWRYETMDSETAIKDGDKAKIRRQIEAIEEEEKAYKKKARDEGIGPDEREEAYINFYRRRGFLEAQLAYVMAKNADVLTHISTSLYHVLDKTDSDSLFKAYPELEFVKVGFATELVGKSLGATVINGSRIEAINLDVKRSTPEVLNGYLAHEIQHAIQEIEGFAPGGDPSMESPRKAEQKAKNISFMKDRLDKSVSERNSLLKQRNEINDKMSAWWDAHEDATREDMLADKDMQQFNREYDELSKQIDEADNTVKFNERWLDATLQANTALGYEGYKKLAGEVEARNVTSRLGMTLEQRRNSLASETEDVAREDQIFLKDGIESGMRFRISEKGKQIQAEVDKFTSKYNSKEVVLVDSEMTDNELEEAMPFTTANRIRREIEEGTLGGYLPNTKKIYIFVDNQEFEDLEDTLFHENMHAIFGKTNIPNEFDEASKDKFKTLREAIRKNYPEKKWTEEVFVNVAANAMVNNDFTFIDKYLPDVYKEEFYIKLKEFGYETEQEIRRRIVVGSTSSESGAQSKERQAMGGTDERNRKSKSAERSEKLKQLFDQVADMGLQGVLGNKEYTSLMVDIYKALPEEVRAEIAEDALRLYGGSVAPAVSDYIGPKSKNSIMDKVVTIVREALRKVGFDLDLNANEVRYMAWRSKKPLDRNNMFEVAEDIDMKYRLKVGEYDGTTPDGGGTRFRTSEDVLNQIKQARREVEKDPSEAQKEAGNYKKGHITLDGFEITLENPKGGTRSGVDKNGKKWSITMNNDYGYIRGTEAVDGDHIDVFLSDNPTEGRVFVVDQSNEEGTFDESKVMYGFNSLDEARNAYLSNYEKGWEKRIMDITEVSKDEFKKWIDSSHKKTKAFSEYKSIKSENIDIRFRVANKLQVRDEYEATIKKGGYQAREAVQDAMLSLRKFQELIEKASGKKIRDFENAWMHENRLSSVVQAEIHDMERKFYKPMMDAVKKLMKAANLEQEQVADYLMLKHGIERNREMAVRKALTDDKGKIDRTRLEQWYQDKRNVRNRAATPHLDTWRKQQEELDNIALLYGADMSRDYSGLTSMFGTDDLADSTQKAYDEVEALENAHPVETESLGKAIKAMTQNTLDKSFESGLMDRKVYDELSKDMYDYYIPLRGFEETTSEEVYAYLDQDRGAFNAPLKRAKGRSSKSDNPIAYLKSIAESGIMQGNRNKMKQSFLNMVINNPSDLVSVREGVWVIYNQASGEWEAASAPAIPNNATPADVEAAMEAWEQQMEQAAQNDPNIKKVSEAADVPYRVVGNKMDQHQIIMKRLGKSYTLTINGNPRLAMALNGQTNPNNTSNDGKVAAFVNNKIGSINRSLAAWYTTRNPDFVASNFMRDTFYTNTIVRAKEGNAYANKFHKNYATVLPKMLGLFRKYENGTLNPADQTEAAFIDFMMNGGETGYSNLKDLEEIKKQISKELKGNRFAKVEALAEKLDILNRAVENTARFAAFLTSREEGRSIAKSVFDAKEISVNFNKKGAGGTFFGMTGQTKFGNLAAMVGAGGRALYVFFNAAIQGTTNLMHVMKINPKGTSAGLTAMFLMGAVIPFLFDDDDDEKDYYDLPEHVRRNHLIIPGTGDAWISIPLPIEYRIMYGMGELLTSWRTGHERGSDIGRKMLNLTGQALPLNFLEEGFDAFIPSALSPVWQVYNNRSWTGLPIYKDNEFNKDDPEYTKAYKNVDRGIYEFTKALYNWTFDEENQKERIDLNPAVIEALARGYFGGLATQLSNIGKTAEIVAGEREFDWRSIPIGNRLFKSGDERTKEKRVTNEYFENMEKLDFLQSRERMLKKTEKGVAVPESDKFKAQKDLETMQGTEVYKKYQEFKKQKKMVDKIRKTIKEKGSTPEREKQLMEAQEKANKSVR